MQAGIEIIEHPDDFRNFPHPPEGIDIIDPPSPGGDWHDDPIDVRPSMQQRMSSMGIYDIESRPSAARRNSGVGKPRDKYVYWTLIKEGDDWQVVRRRRVTAPQEEMERLARKGRKKVLEESRAMSELRSQHFEKLIDDANKAEMGDAIWEPVYIKKDRQIRRGALGGYEVRSMDVILARTSRVAKSRSKSTGGELVDILDTKTSRGRYSKKYKDGSPHDHNRRDSLLDDDDPFQSKPLFHRTGKPMDEFGPIEYNNAGLPPEIPRDRPIGVQIEEKKREKEKDKDNGGKRGKSKDRGKGQLKQGLDDVIAGALSGASEPLDGGHLGENLDDILDDHKRSPRAGSRAGDRLPEVLTGRRSRSQRRPSGSRPRGSRSRSRMSQADSIQYPPNWATGEFVGDSSASSVSSDTSRFGLEREERSSHTSQDTYHSVTGRGSRFTDDIHSGPPRGSDYVRDRKGEHRDGYGPAHHGHHVDGRDAKYDGGRKGYKEHSRGPPLQRATTYEPYRSQGSRRYSKGGGGYYHEPIPEQRQIGYQHDDRPGQLVRRSTYDDGPPRTRPSVELHYPGDMVDLKARERAAEGYMNSQVRDDYLDRREKEVDRRERQIDEAEFETEERRRRERERDRFYYDDRRYLRGYDDYGDRY
jgi:hypothetical protein